MTEKTETPGQRTNSRYISQPDKNYLWMTSAGRCSYPNCRRTLVIAGTEHDGPATIGEFAHIFAHSSQGPRPNPDGFTEKTNSHENLIMLCGDHHTEVDVQSNTHTASDLIRWKADHEKWVSYRLSEEQFTTADLEVITTWVANNTQNPSLDYDILPIGEKIAFNSMSPVTQQMINMGLMRVGEVRTYINHFTKIDADYPQRLLKSLIGQYTELRARGLSSDYIFEELRQFASGRSLDFRKQAAGLAVIVYFFERCEIFEK